MPLLLRPTNPERVLVFVRSARERRLTLELLASNQLEGVVCAAATELCDSIADGAGAALLAEEMLSGPVIERLGALLQEQPPWSDFPLVVFSGIPPLDPERVRSIALLGNVTFLDRPVHVRSMLTSVHSAIRSRRRQYEARRAIESRDAFLAMLGHELRNPLGAISLAVAMVGRKTSGPAPREYGVIERQARHLTRLVDDLLDVARVTHGKVAIQRERLDLTEVVRSAFDTLRVRAETQGLAYELLPGAGPLWVDGDRQRLEQVFGNLLANAVKYTPSGGRVVVEVGRNDGVAIVRVSDTGVGLAPDMLERVFEPFSQVDTTLDRSQGGLGLGLALVRGIVQLHGGSVEVTSAGLGKGSSFVVRLAELADVPAAAQEVSGSPHSPGAKKKILVVEDNADIRDLLTEYLLSAGHDVSCAVDGPDGLRQIVGASPEIAFVDVGLPGFDGLELAKRARSAGATTHLVALTGYGQAEDKQRTQRAGFDDHLVKPVVDADLARAIARASERVASGYSSGCR